MNEFLLPIVRACAADERSSAQLTTGRAVDERGARKTRALTPHHANKTGPLAMMLD